MKIKLVSTERGKEIKKFISDVLEEIFNSPAKGLEDLDDLDKNFEKFWVAEEEGKIIGTIGIKMENGNARVSRMYVKKDVRNKSIGKKLIKTLTNYCKGEGYQKIFLTTYKQMDSVGFYERMGFKIIRRDKNTFLMETKL